MPIAPEHVAPEDIDPLAGSVPVPEDFVSDADTARSSCDPEVLDSIAVDDTQEIQLLGHDAHLVGIRLQLQQAFHSQKDAWFNLTIYAFWIALFFSIPRVWYFLLGRISELVQAIRGGD